jgi:hypothetical protein
MNMPARRESLPAVTAAAVVAIVFSTLGVLGGLLVEISTIVIPDAQTAAGRPSMPPFAKTAAEMVWLFVLALSVFGIFVGVGILRRRNWARITILIWAGFMSFMSAVSLPFVLIVMNTVGPSLPNRGDAALFMNFMKLFFVVFYGIPFSVGIWWLILFTRKRVSVAFTTPLDSPAFSSALDATGFPQFAGTGQAALKPKVACPLPLAIFSVFLIFSALSTLLFLVIPMPATIPMFFFGHVFAGTSPKIFLGILGIVSGVAGFGMLKLKPWALYAEIVVQCVFLANGVVTVFSPNFISVMRSAMQGIMDQYPASPAGNLFLSDNYIRGSMIFGVVLCAAFVALLLFQRSRFLEAAAEANT